MRPGHLCVLYGVRGTNAGQLPEERRPRAVLVGKKLEFQERQDLPSAREQGEDPGLLAPRFDRALVPWELPRELRLQPLL